MDDRKKRIEDLLKNSQESRTSLDTLLVNFGETLYSRAKENQPEFEDFKQYNIYLQDIAESNLAITKIEEKNRRFQELEDAVTRRESEERERAREMSAIYRRLGKALLENSAYDDYTSLFKEQADALSAKLGSLEARIGELDNKEGGNVFSWIGKSAQGLVLRSFLTKAQESQEHLYHDVGERYSRRESVSMDDEVAVILTEIESLRGISKTAMDEISSLKDEKRIISASFGIEGNPQKQIMSVKTHISQVNEALRNLFKKFGMQAAGIDDDITPDRKYYIDSIVTAEDSEIIGRAAKLSQSLAENDSAIIRLKASLAIDDEISKIEKYQRTIEDKKDKIAEFEKNIKDLGESVRDSEARIQELQKQL
jgi:hypothetical protein